MASYGDRNKRGFKEDRIFAWENRGDSSLPLMEFLINMRPDSKRGDIKKWMKYGHLKLNGTVTKAGSITVEAMHYEKLVTGIDTFYIVT